MVAITNDIYTVEDAQFLSRNKALPEDRIMGVETGGCPHTVIRDDTTMNAVAIEKNATATPSRLNWFFLRVVETIYQQLFHQN